MPDMKLFAGNATPELAQRIADRLYISLGDATVDRFSDGEVCVMQVRQIYLSVRYICISSSRTARPSLSSTCLVLTCVLQQ